MISLEYNRKKANGIVDSLRFFKSKISSGIGIGLCFSICLLGFFAFDLYDKITSDDVFNIFILTGIVVVLCYYLYIQYKRKNTDSLSYGVISVFASLSTIVFYVISMITYFEFGIGLVSVAVLLPALGVWHILYYQRKHGKYEVYSFTKANNEYEKKMPEAMEKAKLLAPYLSSLALSFYSISELINIVANGSSEISLMLPLFYFLLVGFTLYMYIVIVTEFRIKYWKRKLKRADKNSKN